VSGPGVVLDNATSGVGRTPLSRRVHSASTARAKGDRAVDEIRSMRPRHRACM
jgi:hypothetical protein